MLNAKALIEEFVAHSPAFYGDLDLHDVDSKHVNIVKLAYAELEDPSQFSFRSWKAQSDLTVPSQLSLKRWQAGGIGVELLKYCYSQLFRREMDYQLRESLLDDYNVIVGMGGKHLIDENPVHKTPGAREFYFLNGNSISTRWLRYIYLTKRILDLQLSDDAVWVDVGSYYGGLQGLIRKYRPKMKIVLVDFHHQLLRSYIYLKQLHPDATHVLPDQLAAYRDLSSVPEGACVYVPVSSFDTIANDTAALTTNFFSLGEMRRTHFERYVTSPLFVRSSYQLFVNRFVSAPFFEKTYDSDVTVLDYEVSGRNRVYFDVFPMHHFLLIKRKVLGNYRFRNLSSSYFEMLSVAADPETPAERQAP